ncbi:hypothetical protein L2E82_07724 [Cichorium intybus]|uniref:Uncharacterized protein n=1 Tax=Cichorium intybus TaxID=13427 RepID=A0ACB9G5Y2_CICIN|nr:hypothetical protein L2E82_07724 [Cichorium intybus]
MSGIKLSKIGKLYTNPWTSEADALSSAVHTHQSTTGDEPKKRNYFGITTAGGGRFSIPSFLKVQDRNRS